MLLDCTLTIVLLSIAVSPPANYALFLQSVMRAKPERNLRSKYICIKQTFNHWTGLRDYYVVQSLCWVYMGGGGKGVIS